MTRLADDERRRVAQELHPVALHSDGAGASGRLGAAMLAVGRRRGGQEDEERHRQEAGDHRPYFRSISVVICAIEYPAFAMRDASSASSRQMLQVAA
jgi:hypothetical protein